LICVNGAKSTARAGARCEGSSGGAVVPPTSDTQVTPLLVLTCRPFQVRA